MSPLICILDNISDHGRTVRASPLQIFTTQRLRIRTWQDEDFDSLYELLSDPVTMAHWPQPLNRSEARAWLDRSFEGMAEHGFARWCCERLEDGRIIGDVGIVRTQLEGQWVNDLGYIIAHEFWRSGFAYEASRGAVQWAGSHGLDSLEANMAMDNTASVALAEKLGMTRLREFVKAGNRNKLTYWYELGLN